MIGGYNGFSQALNDSLLLTLHSPSKGRCRAASCRSGIHGGAVVYLTVNTTQVNTTVGRPRHLLFEYAQYNIYWCLLVLVQEKSVELTAWLTVPSRTSKSLEHVQHVQ